MIPLPLIIPENNQPLPQETFARVVRDPATGQRSLHANAFFDAGDILCSFAASALQEQPDYLTLQLNEHTHISLKPDVLQFTNHSCDPNVFFDTTTMQVIALRSIQPGDEISFFYPSTEWKMAQPFHCTCGAARCLGWISGAADIPLAVLQQYQLTAFIRSQLSKQSLL